MDQLLFAVVALNFAVVVVSMIYGVISTRIYIFGQWHYRSEPTDNYWAVVLFYIFLICMWGIGLSAVWGLK